MKCYVCSNDLIAVADKLYKCTSCKTLQRLNPEEYYQNILEVYNSKYFAERYESRYGRKASEDIENMRKITHRRLDTIENIYLREGECSGCGSGSCGGCYVRNFVSSLKNKSLLDIGCGIGVFIDMAKRRGFNIRGIDINKEILHLLPPDIRDRVIITDFANYETNEKFDIITIWYVIEHLPNPREVLRKVWGLLKYGGILAISTPNGNGFTQTFKPKFYYSLVPEDHIFEFSPDSLSILLKEENFKVIKIVNTGFHPDRVSRIPIIKNILELYQRITNVGDTFEIYAVKKVQI
ncbi:MAG: class I SAM-dependent methyltransferase [Spirochaetia bacterium]|nr:class I SAM-dependent methyltransferase [Spirochaetota bacterium]MCX8096078.1 class I SAM-dependent methyltransferase [Spirochaetota bacterium]MDW8112196.1 class I SAM-dependent methyltransferase [Spirochaetia bacterium]